MSAYIFDTETTDKDDPEIIEAAWIHYPPKPDLAGLDDQTIPPDLINDQAFGAQRFVRRYQPKKRITFGAIATHHIFPDELVGCPPSTEFQLPADCRYLIGHNIDFDWRAIGCPANVKRICTDAIARHTWQDADAYSLVALCYRVEGKLIRELAQSAHGAMADCELVTILVTHILLERPTVTTWEQLWQLSEQCRIPLVIPFSKHKGTRLEHLELSFIDWCLRQDWIDSYLRLGLERVLRGENPQTGKPVVHTDGLPF